MSAAQSNPKSIYVDGAMVPYENATIHVSSVAAKYGANVFEGLCAYAGDSGQSFVFRAREHLKRLRNSIRMMEIDCGYDEHDYLGAILSSIRENQIGGDAHIRLTVFITGEGYNDRRGPASVVCIANPRPSQPLDKKSVHAMVSTWRRIDDSVMPPRIKAGANYQNSRLALLEALRNGYEQAILLTIAGKVSESTSASVVMVRNGTLVTTPITSGIIESLTRATLLELAANELGIRIEQREIDRSELYVAEEVLFCGSGQQLRPVLSIDRFPVGNGRVGPITRRLWDVYEAAVRGRNESRSSWLTPVFEAAKP
jgi:branched-chain amino acid aminotransferase